MARLPPRPRRAAAAVSGGRDSMALALLAAQWAGREGVELLAFTVDHGLRAEAAAEAAQTVRWLNARGIDCRVLRWEGEKPPAGLQAAAREARYRLLHEACRAGEADALLLGHQLEDQAETYLMRLARGAGLDGLAAMAPDSARDGLRLLRPLLGVSRARLTATLKALGQPWLDDPGNADPRFERARLRALVPALGAERLAAAAETARLARAALDEAAAALVARAARLDPAGWATIDPGEFRRDPAGPRALRLLLHAIGGDPYPPSPAGVEALLAGLGGPGRTLAHCRALPWRGAALLCREARDLPPATPAAPGRATRWDRFVLELGPDAPPDLEIGPLAGPNAADWAPRPARPSLPGLSRAGEPAFLPRPGQGPGRWNSRLFFRPSASLDRIGFRVA
jgi:tRNA(Ile)-lysidine synthase